jgi:hypothetical protein
MNKPRKNRTVERLIVAGAFVALSGAAALAFPNIPAVGGNVVDQAEHFATCFGLMITDPDKHVAECGIGESRTIDTTPDHQNGGVQMPDIITTTDIPETTTTTGGS